MRQRASLCFEWHTSNRRLGFDCAVLCPFTVFIGCCFCVVVEASKFQVPFAKLAMRCFYLLCHLPQLLCDACTTAVFLYRRVVCCISSTLRARDGWTLVLLVLIIWRDTCAEWDSLFSRFWGAFTAHEFLFCYSTMAMNDRWDASQNCWKFKLCGCILHNRAIKRCINCF